MSQKIIAKRITLCFLISMLVMDIFSQELRYLDDKSRKGEFTVEVTRDLPNIIFITVDMISPDCYLPSRSLSKHINTPNINQLAREGTKYINAFCTSPLCGPSRAAIFTGRYQPYLTNGERAPAGMQRHLNSDDIIFQEYLKNIGYNMRHVGKCHVGLQKFDDAFGENMHAWDRWSPPVYEDDDYLAYIKQLGVELPVYQKEIVGKQFDRKTPGNSLGGWIQQKNGKPFPADAQYSVFLAQKAIQQIDAALIQKPETPMYLQLDFFDPHQPYSIPSGFEERYEKLKQVVKLHDSYKRLIDNDFSPLENEPSIYSIYRKYWGLYDENQMVDYIIGHLLQVEVVDYALGMLFDELKRRNMWENSLIIFSADHGDMNGRLGLADKGVYFQPDIFRVPLYIKAPHQFDQITKQYDRPVSTLDISKTILSFAGIHPPAYMDGVDLTGTLQGEHRAELKQIFQTGWHVGVNYGCGYQLYKDDQQWFYGYNMCTGNQEIYDINKDDQVNLFYKKEYFKIREEIILELAAILQSDPRWLGYWSAFRLHNAELLPVAAEDMQMVIPNER